MKYSICKEKGWIEVEFILKTMYSEYVYYVCLKDRTGTIWNNNRA